MKTLWVNFCVFLVILIFCEAKNPKPPKVKVENGVLVGKWETSNDGKLYQAFLGVPYAKPPVGDDRFKEAERIDKPWTGEYNATIEGSACLQYDHFTMQRNEDGLIYDIHGDEDCLFLNVFTKDTGVRNKDVSVYIHGGAFMFGVSNTYSPRYLMDQDDLVFVTINYRVGVLGFLTTGDNVVPGNNGLKDQVAALEWVQRNIAAFGGDPSKVSISGLSAGGASVHYHYLSPLSKGLFNNGYSYSGSVLCPWAFVPEGIERSVKLAKLLGCPVHDSRAMVKCLRKRPARQIVSRVSEFQPWLFNPFTVFGPVAEIGSARPFIDQHPLELLQSGRILDVPWLTGFTSSEGLYPAAEFIISDRHLDHLNKNWPKLSWTLLFHDRKSGKKTAEKIRQKYFGEREISQETSRELTQVIGDGIFVVPGMRAARLQAKHNTQPVYLYRFDYRGNTSVSKYFAGDDNDYGVSHGDDLSYVIGFPGADTRATENDIEMGKLLSQLYLRFETTGEVPEHFNWSPVSRNPNDELEYLEISSPTSYKIEKNSNLANYDFWINLAAANTKDEL